MVCNDWDSALVGLEQSLRQDPKDSSTCRRLADAYAIRGRLKDTVSTYLHLSDILQSQGDLENALQISVLVLQLQPESEAGRLQRIALLERRRDYPSAVSAVRELARLYVDQGRGDKAIDLLERARRGQPEELDLILELAETHLAEGHLAQGLELFAQGAAACQQSGQRERACEALRRMKVLAPTDTSIMLRLSLLYLELGRLHESEQELRGVLRQNLNHEGALMLLGEVSQLKGQGRDACLAFNRLISLNPERWDALEKMAEVLQSQGLISDAIRHYLQSAEGYLAQGRREQAVRPLRHLLALDPDHPGAVSHLATLDAPVQPLELDVPTVPVVAEPIQTTSGELRILKRRQLPGQEAKNSLLKPMPGSQPAPKIALAKPLLPRTPNQPEESPLFAQSITSGPCDCLPDFDGSSDWLEEAEELPDFSGSCDWLEEAMALHPFLWREISMGVACCKPSTTGWPGEVFLVTHWNKLSEELEFWARTSQENPELWQARAEWADLCLKAGLCDQAIELYRQVVHLVPSNDEMRHRLIQALIWNDETSAAAEACLELADLYAAQNEFLEAKEMLHLLLQLEPQHVAARRRLVDWSEEKVARHHLGILGEHAFAQEIWPEVYAVYGQILDQDQANWMARQRRLQAAAALGHQGEAAVHGQRLLEHYCQSQQWLPALQVCEQLMRWETGHTRLWVKLLEECGSPAQLAQGRLVLAQELVGEQQFEPAVALLAESFQTHRPAAEMLVSLLSQNEDERFSTWGARLVEQYREGAEFDQALELLDRLPVTPELLFARGQVYSAQGQWQAALEQFQQTRRLAGWFHKSTHALALCLKQREGMEELARRQVEKALLVEGPMEDIEALRQLLS